MPLKQCPKCKNVFLDQKYCYSCGTKLLVRPEPPKCACGEKFEEYYNFCPGCGRAREKALGESPEKDEPEKTIDIPPDSLVGC